MNLRVVIPSARAENLISCVLSLRRCEPSCPASSIIVVDDGAREVSEAMLPAVTWVTGLHPFVFARNVNLGIVAADDADVLLLNDDAQMRTTGGLIGLSSHMRQHPEVGVCSAAVEGVVCNPRQHPMPGTALRDEPGRIAFVAVYIPRRVIDRVGLLDERFSGYGYDDFDYCRRVRRAGYTVAIWDGCIVDHSGHSAQSTYRSRQDWSELMALNRARYIDKWGDDA